MLPQQNSQVKPSSIQNQQPPLIKKLGKYQFSLNQKLGSGLTGDVYVGVDTQTHELVCVKVIDRALFTTQQQTKMLNNQVKCQQLLQCENCVKILDVFDNNSFSFIVAELCEGGDLYKLIKFSPTFLDQNLVRIFGLHIARALLNIKKMRIVHRDIKSQNILIRKGTAKIGDFGFAIEEKKLQKKQPFNLGSPLYMSLQALQNNEYSYKSDIFSFGIVLYEMLHKISPWETASEAELKLKMKNQSIKFRQQISPQVQDLIKKCLQIDINNRINIQEVLQHPYFKIPGYNVSEPNKTQLKQSKQEVLNKSPTDQKKSQSQQTVQEEGRISSQKQITLLNEQKIATNA